MKHHASIQNYEIKPFIYQEWISDLKKNDKEDVIITIKKAHKRTSRQNKYYFGVLIPLIAKNFVESGYCLNINSTEVAHEFFKQLLLSETIVIDNVETKVAKSTTDLSTGEFEEYLSSVREYCSDKFGLFLPLPNEVL